MSVTASVLKAVRLTHLYLGVFIVPAVLFFALTGALQSFSLHETTKGSSYSPARWIVVLAQLHKKQTITVPAKKAPPAQAVPALSVSAQAVPVRMQEPAKPLSATPVLAPATIPMKIYFAIVSIALIVSTVTGLYMSYKFTRNKLAIGATLLAGCVVPIVLLVV